MAGSREAGLKARDTNLKNNPDYYREMGRLGGKAGRGHKFGHGKVDPRVIGAIGGKKSKRKGQRHE